MIVLILILVIFICCYLFLVKGAKISKEKVKWLISTNFAHRGLFSKDQIIPENSSKAFEEAIKNSYGIELDVGLTKDKKLIVFHDDNLLRMTGINKRINECTLEEIKKLTLANTTYKILTFAELLTLINGRVPLIIEIKSCKDRITICSGIVAELENYNGSYCIESFDPLIIGWFKKNEPTIVRGQLSMRYKNEKKFSFIVNFILENMLLNFISRPHFIAYRFEDRDKLSFRLNKFFGIITVAWTVNSAEAVKICSLIYDTLIFEHCNPKYYAK